MIRRAAASAERLPCKSTAEALAREVRCVCTNVPRSAALRGALSQLSPPSDAAPERPRVPLGSAQRFERFVAAGFLSGALDASCRRASARCSEQ